MIPAATDLNYFIEVANTLNVSRASERLGISQPSLTVAIQRLEHSVGTPLLIRSKKGVLLTPAGKLLAAHAKNLIAEWEDICSQALASASKIQGRYSIGCHPSVALYTLPGILAPILEENENLEIKLVHDLSRKITEQVIQMEVDVGIAVNPVRHPDLIIRELCKDEVTFWVGKGHRRIQNFRSGEAVLICDLDLLQTQALLKKIKNQNIKYRRIISSSSLELITELTASGEGIGIIPGRVAAAAHNRGLKPIANAPIYVDEICLLYRVENKNIQSIQLIANQIINFFKNK